MPGERVVDQRRRRPNASTLPNSGSETGPVSCSASAGQLAGGRDGERHRARQRRGEQRRRGNGGTDPRRSPGRSRRPAGRPSTAGSEVGADRGRQRDVGDRRRGLAGGDGDHGLQRRELAAGGPAAGADRRLQLRARTAARRSRWPDTGRSRSRCRRRLPRAPPPTRLRRAARRVEDEARAVERRMRAGGSRPGRRRPARGIGVVLTDRPPSGRSTMLARTITVPRSTGPTLPGIAIASPARPPSNGPVSDTVPAQRDRRAAGACQRADAADAGVLRAGAGVGLRLGADRHALQAAGQAGRQRGRDAGDVRSSRRYA